MEKYVYKGKNKEEILSQALEELNVKPEEIIYKESEEKQGLFQVKRIIIEIVKIKDIAELGKNLLEELLERLKIKGQIEKFINESGITYNIHSNNSAMLIGKNGRILDSISTFINKSIDNKIFKNRC